MPDPLVSIVIPAYNPTALLLEAMASAAAQTHPRIEIILVNDGSDQPESLAILEQAARGGVVYLEQSNQGPSAARNAGFRIAQADYVVPLDADDRLSPTYIATCLSALDAGHAFVYTDYRVIGAERYDERPGHYNLYRLLDRNYLTYAALLRKQDWERAGGYDEAMRLGYEDWEFWLRLGSQGGFGRHVPQSLFRYRRQGITRSDTALAHHSELVDYIRQRHPELYEYENRARIKARWSPAVSIIALERPGNQTIEDIEVIAPGESPASPAVLNALDQALEPEAAELSALAAWSGGGNQPATKRATPVFSNWHRHLSNAGLLSIGSWTQHPLRSLARLIPLRVKEGINQLAGRLVFDLSFYLQFQPNSVLLGNAIIEPLVYYPKAYQGRKRIALVTPHLGPGGAEAVLYDIASTLCSNRFELLLLATQSGDDHWLTKWRQQVDHVYDLARVVTPERMVVAIGSIVSNWRCDYLLIQNSLYGYAAIPHLRKMLPDIKIIDVIHSVDDAWDQIRSTVEVAPEIDQRVAMSQSVRDRLVALGTAGSKIALARNGVDLERFRPAPHPIDAVKTILFAARLDAVKRPLMVADIAKALSALRPKGDFRVIVAGDGPERERLERRVRKFRLDAIFDFRGQVDDLSPLYAASHVVILPSRSEGVPLVVLEALASGRPVVASKVGAIPEVLDSSCGILIEGPEPREFARAIHTLLDQPELRERLGAAGRRKMETMHDIRKTRELWTGLIDQGTSLSVSSTSRSTAIE
jgi:glycosyltransferase involved in cell wall biosynthesis